MQYHLHKKRGRELAKYNNELAVLHHKHRILSVRLHHWNVSFIVFVVVRLRLKLLLALVTNAQLVVNLP